MTDFRAPLVEQLAAADPANAVAPGGRRDASAPDPANAVAPGSRRDAPTADPANAVAPGGRRGAHQPAAGGASREIRAVYTADTVTVYQAYRPEIALPAVAEGRFTAAFSRERMTWIKPSFLWMMYRCGWATKPGQEHVLAVEIRRDGFEWALDRACLSHYDPDVHASAAEWKRQLRQSPVRVQWDPERDLHARPVPGVRSLQLGLSGEASRRYADEWTVSITDVTGLAHRVHALVRERELEAARALLPPERDWSRSCA